MESLANLNKNLSKMLSFLLRDWTSLNVVNSCIFKTIITFSELASSPVDMIMYPINFSEVTPKVHLAGLGLMW